MSSYLAGNFSFTPKWSLTRMEPTRLIGSPFGEGNETIDGAYPSTDGGEDDGASWTPTNVSGRKRPRYQYNRGDEGSFNVTVIFRNETQLDESATSLVAVLKSWKDPLPELGRPPVCSFNEGEFNFTGFIERLSIKISDKWLDGRVKQYTVTISMKAMEVGDVDLSGSSLVDPTQPPASTRFKPIPQGATYEDMAREEYGSPLVGIAVRQDSLDAFPQAGDVVMLPSRENYLRRILAPDSFCLSDDPRAVAARQALFAKHSGYVLVRGG